ncbi:hypothetical protein Ddye_023177 [Dipteronia dyeriana]|uniref:Uncharacterized protein n=1 Tax=Dipteronia dyeriana TaxID=168575 RepID=A0AAD9WRW5_9ROSI|nr:hypothetical protein Ddye_023177 [Dipteronia dyeriana]
MWTQEGRSEEKDPKAKAEAAVVGEFLLQRCRSGQIGDTGRESLILRRRLLHFVVEKMMRKKNIDEEKEKKKKKTIRKIK